jgi:hypothetical protein
MHHVHAFMAQREKIYKKSSLSQMKQRGIMTFLQHFSFRAQIAQLVEQRIRNAKVVSSILALGNSS